MGIVATLIMAVGGYFYLIWREKKLKAAGIVYDEPTKGQEVKELNPAELPNPYLTFLPLVIVVLLLNVFKLNIITSLIIGILCIMVLNLTKRNK